LEATFVVHVLRPYTSRRSTEIVSAPKVYAFDTGFVCYHRGWHHLRPGDLGALWEHFVLNEIQAHGQFRELHYWRDKRGHEVDFILASRGHAPVAIECKWSASEFDPTNLQAFRRQHPRGENLVVANDVEHAFTQSYRDLVVRFVSVSGLIAAVMKNK
jgi:predicted AAA+ superfamily ATPase